MKTQQKKQQQLWIGILVSVFSLAIIIWLADPLEIWNALQSANYLYLFPFIGCLLLFLYFRAIRWRILLKHTVPTAEVFHIQNIGYMLTMLLPFRLGDVGRVVLISNREDVSLLQGGSSMITERLLDLLFFVVLFPFAIANLATVPDELRLTAQIGGIVSLIGILILIIAANQRPLVETIYSKTIGKLISSPTPRKLLNDILDGLHALTNWRDGFSLLFWSIVIWLPVLVSYDLILRAVQLTLSPLSVALVVCCAAFGVAAPSSPGQFGVFHAAVTFAIAAMLGHAEATAVSFAFIYHTTQYLFFILMGLIALNVTNTEWGKIVAMVRRNRESGV